MKDLGRPLTSFVHSPFNLIELLLLREYICRFHLSRTILTKFLPLCSSTAFELCLPVKVYSKINQYILSVLFFPALIVIALYEKHWENKHSEELKSLMEDDEDEVSLCDTVAGVV